jgi:hypothetical protein
VIGFAASAFAVNEHMFRNVLLLAASAAFLAALEAQPFVTGQQTGDPHRLIQTVHERNTPWKDPGISRLFPC